MGNLKYLVILSLLSFATFAESECDTNQNNHFNSPVEIDAKFEQLKELNRCPVGRFEKSLSTQNGSNPGFLSEGIIKLEGDVKTYYGKSTLGDIVKIETNGKETNITFGLCKYSDPLADYISDSALSQYGVEQLILDQRTDNISLGRFIFHSKGLDGYFPIVFSSAEVL